MRDQVGNSACLRRGFLARWRIGELQTGNRLISRMERVEKWRGLKRRDKGDDVVGLTPFRFGLTQTEETMKTLCRPRPCLHSNKHSPGCGRSATGRPRRSCWDELALANRLRPPEVNREFWARARSLVVVRRRLAAEKCSGRCVARWRLAALDSPDEGQTPAWWPSFDKSDSQVHNPLSD